MMKRLIILFQLCIFSLLAVGQTMEVHGRVLDGAQKGEPMIGATVMVKGTNQGTVTDIDGLFVLQVQDMNGHELELEANGITSMLHGMIMILLI